MMSDDVEADTSSTVTAEGDNGTEDLCAIAFVTVHRGIHRDVRHAFLEKRRMTIGTTSDGSNTLPIFSVLLIRLIAFRHRHPETVRPPMPDVFKP